MTNLAKYISILLLTSSSVINVANAVNHTNSFSFNKLSESLCENVANNNLLQLRLNLSHAKTHIRTIYPQVSCDGQSLLLLATVNHAQSIVTYLNLKAKPELLLLQNKSVAVSSAAE
jgi:hypothetical protein